MSSLRDRLDVTSATYSSLGERSEQVRTAELKKWLWQAPCSEHPPQSARSTVYRSAFLARLASPRPRDGAARLQPARSTRTHPRASSKALHTPLLEVFRHPRYSLRSRISAPSNATLASFPGLPRVEGRPGTHSKITEVIPWHSRILPCLKYVIIVYYQELSGEFTGSNNGWDA